MGGTPAFSPKLLRTTENLAGIVDRVYEFTESNPCVYDRNSWQESES